MLEQCTKNVFDRISKGKKIVAVGAGKIGKKFIEEYGNQKNIIICDNDVEKQKNGIVCMGDKWKVKSIKKINYFETNEICIVLTTIHYNELYNQIIKEIDKNIPIFVYPFIEDREKQLEKQVKQCLSDYYYHNHFDLSKKNDFINTEYEKLQKNNKMVLPYLPIYITTKCTLNCEKCNNLIPLIKDCKKVKDFAEEKIERSLLHILDCVQEITFCELVGGEPFLYGNLENILNFVGNQKKIRQIVIVTNGTVIPQQNILLLLKKYNVLVRISDYGLFDKIAKLVIELEKYDINVRILQDMKWNDPGDIQPRKRSHAESFLQYNKCIFSLRCKYLMEDKLYTCARIASLALLGEYSGKEDILSIDEHLTEPKLKEFYLHNEGGGCSYCDLCSIDAGYEIPAAIQKGGQEMGHSLYTIIRNDYLERLKNK